MLSFFAVPLAFSAQGPLTRIPVGSVVLAGDLAWVPKPSATLARSSGVCGFQKSENTGLASVFPRPRVIVGLPGGLSVEATYLPPVTVQDATPNFGSLAVAYTSEAPVLPGHLNLALRAHATFGSVKGPITCPRSGLQTSSPTGNCYGNQPSADTYEPNVRGVEAATSARTGAIGWYAGAGWSQLTPHFQVDFTSLSNSVDHNTVDVTLSRVSLFAGGSWQWTPAVTLSAQVYSVPDDATTGRLGIAWRLR